MGVVTDEVGFDLMGGHNFGLFAGEVSETDGLDGPHAPAEQIAEEFRPQSPPANLRPGRFELLHLVDHLAELVEERPLEIKPLDRREAAQEGERRMPETVLGRTLFDTPLLTPLLRSVALLWLKIFRWR